MKAANKDIESDASRMRLTVREMTTATKQRKSKSPVPLMKFNSMSPARRRVVIARDVIAHVDAGRFQAGGGWCVPNNGHLVHKNKNEQVRSVLSAEECHGCALGAIFYAAAIRFNDITIGNLGLTGKKSYQIERNQFAEYLGRFFDECQTEIIENCYELGNGSLISEFDKLDMKTHEIVAVWIDGFLALNRETRLRAICLNIIRHRGTFDPSDMRAD